MHQQVFRYMRCSKMQLTVLFMKQSTDLFVVMFAYSTFLIMIFFFIFKVAICTTNCLFLVSLLLLIACKLKIAPISATT